MANLNGVKKQIKSVNDIAQMTKAMQLVSAAKMRRSRVLHDSVTPFFSLCAESIQEIQNSSKDADMDNPFFVLNQKTKGETWKVAYFVLSGDQGLAGAYNNNMVKIAEEHVRKKILENTAKGISTDYKLFVFGKLAREKLIRNGYIVDSEFSFPITEPNFYQARNVGEIIRNQFLNHEFDLVYLIYTNMKSAINMVPVVMRLLPVDLKSISSILPENLEDAGLAIGKGATIEYSPSPNTVLNYLTSTYLNAMLYGAMVEAYSSEQTARMTAMDNATNNADEMMKSLQLIRNRARQSKITNELTEIINGATQANNL